MKKQIFLLAFLTSIFMYGQEANSKLNIGLKYQIGEIGTIGIEAEYFDNENSNTPLLFNLNLTGMTYKANGYEIDGYGFEVGFGSRSYLKKDAKKGFYLDSYINYGSISFDDDISFNGFKENIDGKFRYISILNTSFGHKFMINKFIIEPSISGRYNIEIKGKGDIDNKNIDNFLFNLGIRLAYTL